MERFRHKTYGLRGLNALVGRRIRMRAHVDDRDRRGGLNVPRGVDAVYSPLQIDVHEHDMGVMREGMLNRLRAITSQGDHLIPEAAELPGHG